MTDRAEQRPCLHCGTVFTWTPASPRKRFCSQPCRLAWWGTRRRQATTALRRGDIRLPGGQPHGDDSHATGNDARGGDARSHDPGTLAATPACPHCRQPVAIVAWLVPPAAANIATPPRHAAAINENQQLTR
jgi:endogenous inhibitor of DNA gyrase (YacG/DUF329 family)